MATLYGIAVKPQRKAEMLLESHANITLQNGIESDCRGQGGSQRSRQITLISFGQWAEACEDLGIVALSAFPWHLRRANLCILGFHFGRADVGRQLQIGPSVILEITGETTPCKRMDEVFKGLQDVLVPDFRAGVTCRVINEGEIGLTDPVRYLA